MHLHRRNRHGFERIENGNAGVGIGGGIDDNAVCPAAGLLNLIHNGAFVVGLEQLAVNAVFRAGAADQLLQGRIALRAVNGRLTKAQHIDVGAVDNQKFHASTSRICVTVSSNGPLLSTRTSAKRS